MDEKEKRAPEQKKEKKGFLEGFPTRLFEGDGSKCHCYNPDLASGSIPSGKRERQIPAGLKEAVIQLNVNDRFYRLRVKSNWTLLEVLRRELGLTGTKKACDRGNCGACTVLVEGKAVYACSLLAISMEGKKIVTVEGLADGETLHPIQKSFSEHGGYQCGFCTSGQMMAAKALLDRNPKPSRERGQGCPRRESLSLRSLSEDHRIGLRGRC